MTNLRELKATEDISKDGVSWGFIAPHFRHEDLKMKMALKESLKLNMTGRFFTKEAFRIFSPEIS